MSWLAFFYEEPVHIHLGSWISVGDLQINYGLLLDSLSMTVMVPVGIVTLCVLFYALDYMRHDPNRNRFYIILSVFGIFMTVLVVSENYVMMFIGWEFVGVISYLLISFWNTRIAAMKSALSALLLNRMGDTFFVICLGCMISYFHAVDFETIELLSPHVDTLLLNSLAIMLLLAATAKSAQLGLHGWLLSAMEGWIRALLKFHYMLEHPIQLSWSSITSTVKSGSYTPMDITNYISYFGKIQDEGQSAGNLLKGSSETTRETYDYTLDDISLNDEFKLWLIGFTEGDGSFILNKNGSLEFKITQSSIDAQILFYIKKELGFGSVKIQDKKNKTHHYRVRDKKNLLKIINIFNGNLFLNSKKEQFKLWLEGYNKYYNQNIKLLDNNFKPTLKDTWLLGFTDAEGCFTCSALINENNPATSSVSGNQKRIYVRFVLSQKMDEDLAIYLAKLINGYHSYLKSYDGYNIVTSFSKINQINLYFKKHKLKTKKYLDYLNWYKVLLLVKNKEHLTQEGFYKIKTLIEKHRSKKNKNMKI
mgnify:CR=1 FL=1